MLEILGQENLLMDGWMWRVRLRQEVNLSATAAQ